MVYRINQINNLKHNIDMEERKILNSVWLAIGAFGMTGLVLTSIFAENMTLMLPGSCILTGIGVLISGAILHVRTLKVCALSALFFLMTTSCYILIQEEGTIWFHIIFSLGFIWMMVVPGHYLNKEAKKHVQGA